MENLNSKYFNDPSHYSDIYEKSYKLSCVIQDKHLSTSYNIFV